MLKLTCVFAWVAGSLAAAEAPRPYFAVQKIDGGIAEGCLVFDMDRDKDLDIACGGSWYEAPAWTKHPLRKVQEGGGEFANDCGEVLLDANEDGWPDIISAGWFVDGVFYYENPKGAGGLWPEKKISSSPNTEGILGVDVDGDGRIDVLTNHYSPFEVAWIEGNKDGFRKHIIGGKEGDRHGIGFGDVNGDGRGDVIGPNGWYEAPEDRRAGKWTWHPNYPDAERDGKPLPIPDTGIPMLVFDVNADGLNDIIYGAGHEYGLHWLEQVRRDARTYWRRHIIDEEWSQAHALTLVDIDGDKEVELITGKRWRGHGDGDPGGQEPICVFWYDIDRKTASFKRHPIIYGGFGDPGVAPGKHPFVGVGVGMQIQPADMDGDGDIDLVLPGKSGLYLLENKLKRKK